MTKLPNKLYHCYICGGDAVITHISEFPDCTGHYTSIDLCSDCEPVTKMTSIKEEESADDRDECPF
jgi:hypothetical protein